MDPFSKEPLPIDVINMSRIRVAGIGGLGLVAMALVVAWDLPRIGLTLSIGAITGSVLAIVLILRRRQSGAMPSSGRRPGANTMLSIDVPPPPDGKGDTRRPIEQAPAIQPAQ